MNNLTGTIKAIGNTNQVTDTFKKRELVIEIKEGDYSNVGVFEATQDKCVDLDNFQIGNVVTVSFFWSGNTKPWTDKNGVERYFNSLKIGSITMAHQAGAQPQQQQPAPQQAPDKPFEAPPMDGAGGALEDDGIPF